MTNKEAEVCREFEEMPIYIPDEYRFASEGHWVDVENSGYDRERIKLHFRTPDQKEVEVDITIKEATDLRKELKAATTLVRIADDF